MIGRTRLIYGKKVLFVAIFAGAGCVTFFLLRNQINSQGRASQQADTSMGGQGNLISQPDRDADIYGMITSVKGNQITILKFDPSTMPGAKKNGPEEQRSADENALSLGTNTSMPGGGSMPAGGPPREGGMPGRSSSGFSSGKSGSSGNAGDFGGSSSTREDKLEELKATSIGTETIIVPVGIPISVGSFSADGVSTAESGNLTDLTSDTVVVLWLQDTDASADQEGEQRIAHYISVTGKVDMDNSNNQ